MNFHFPVDLGTPQNWDNINLQDNASKFVPWPMHLIASTLRWLLVHLASDFPPIFLCFSSHLFFHGCMGMGFGINRFRFWFLVFPFPCWTLFYWLCGGKNWIDKLLNKLFIEKTWQKLGQLSLRFTRNCISMRGIPVLCSKWRSLCCIFLLPQVSLWPSSIGKFDLN